ncbi:uncharacterized protein BDZ83DRAFT_653509 [Colletotrichum acutatum]|uniref:Uncharacterized protein n=1 Tax=Glomerella acutata TaxID=27357 RepID=A0AAD8XCR6_GLOAC|nr:uncharacterized protein BDZ83DRAFT_653509 [Colletotrichum acutatum]KAK1722954.1 hypothetical protein BDZ83DRAFT_653509 [Colletotrichum acutatum]
MISVAMPTILIHLVMRRLFYSQEVFVSEDIRRSFIRGQGLIQFVPQYLSPVLSSLHVICYPIANNMLVYGTAKCPQLKNTSPSLEANKNKDVLSKTLLDGCAKLATDEAVDGTWAQVGFIDLTNPLNGGVTWQEVLPSRTWVNVGTHDVFVHDIRTFVHEAQATERHLLAKYQRLYVAGARFTGSEEHENYVKWLEGELKRLPGLEVSSSHVSVLAWQPKGSLAESVSLTLTKDHDQGCPVEIQVAGAVPYSLPTSGRQGHLIYVPRSQKISGNEVKGKMILRDFPARPVPYSLGLIPSYFATRDLEGDLMNFYDRPGFADEVIHQDLLDAGEAQVAGVFFLFDIPRDQVLSYFEPHKGTHYEVPAAYLGIEERPSPPVVQAVIDAVMRRELDRVIVTRGVSTPNLYKTPTFTSFGGIGTYYHNLLLPTTSLISGPWSLWAPSFGPDSIDVFRLRQQTLALGDVYVQLEKASREEIVSGYETCRKTRALSGSSYIFEEPPEQASDAKSLVGNVIKY